MISPLIYERAKEENSTVFDDATHIMPLNCKDISCETNEVLAIRLSCIEGENYRRAEGEIQVFDTKTLTLRSGAFPPSAQQQG